MLIHVPLDQLDDNPFQRRQDYGDVAGLATDIKQRGLLQIPRGRLLFEGKPVDKDRLAKTLDTTNGWPGGALFTVQLAFGHRRLRAFIHLQRTQAGGYGTMPVYVEALSDDAMLDAVWSENQHRSDINPIEQAELLAEKLERARAAGGNQQTVAAEWGLDRSTVANKVRLLDLPADVQTAVRERRLSERQAQALLPVMELEQKLNGAKVDWGTPAEAWRPAAPAAYVARVLAEPEKATSDAIRGYVQSAVELAGKPLSDDFAKFDAGQGKAILQATCKDCPKRHNQVCLHPPCHEARLKQFMAVLPEWAARETGLPYSSDAADFPKDYSEVRAVLADWKAGRHEDLVIGIKTDYYPGRPFTEYGSSSLTELLRDWKRAIILGRKPPTTAAAGPQATPAAQVLLTDDELVAWRKAQGKADRERTARVKHVMRARIQPLMEDETALRALMSMLDGYAIRQWLEKGETPTPEALFDSLFALAWKRVDNGNYDGTFGNRAALRKLLHAAAVTPDAVDPADRALMLVDIGQVALLNYEETRRRADKSYIRPRLAGLREALAEFDAAPAVVAGNAELEQLAAYIRAAVAFEEARLLPADPAKEAAEVADLVAELDAIERAQAESEGALDELEAEIAAADAAPVLRGSMEAYP